MDFTPIRLLRLRSAFSNEPKFQAVGCDQDFLNELFEWTDRGIIFIHDDASVGHSVLVEDTNGLGTDKLFTIINTCHKDLFLWHIDGVLFKKDSKCDCAFISHGILGFVEFKSNAANNSDDAIEDNYEKAVTQLLLTFDEVNFRCLQAGVDLKKTVTVEAYAVFNRTVPRNNAYQKKMSARFILKTGGVPLFFRSETPI